MIIKDPKKIAVTIYCDEYYPFYSMYTWGDDNTIEIPLEKYEWIKSVQEEFEKTQAYLESLEDNK